MPDMNYDRRIPRALRTALDGTLQPLVERRNENPALIDLQHRRDTKDAAHSWVSLYVGLSTVLDVHARDTDKSGETADFWLATHATYRANSGFEAEWSQPMSSSRLSDQWKDVDRYLDRVTLAVKKQFTEQEGLVHAAMCSSKPESYRAIDREAAPAFRNDATKSRLIEQIGKPILEAVAADDCKEDWWPSIRFASSPKRFGTSPDILAIDKAGRLLVIEAKPSRATDGITWGPAQLRFYADLWAALLASNPSVKDNIASMLETRVSLGLASPGQSTLAKPLRIVPILAIGAGRASRTAIKRAAMVQEAIDAGAKNASPVAKPSSGFWIHRVNLRWCWPDARTDPPRRARDRWKLRRARSILRRTAAP
ncbi:MAG: hypothetical protein WD757_03115 [Actinomycetota bacterium]